MLTRTFQIQRLTADPTTPAHGQAWYNTTSGLVKFCQNGTVTTLGGGSLAWGDLTSRPTTVAAAGLTDAATTAALATGLAGKADAGHGHSWTAITDKPSTLAGYGVGDQIEAGVTTPSGLWGYLTAGRGNAGVRAEYAGMMRMRPYVARAAGTITAVAINVSTAVTGSLAKVALYASDPTTGQPAVLIAETADMACDATGSVTAAIGPVPQVAGVQYWVAVRVSAGQTLSTDPSGGRLNGMSTPSIATTVPTCISRVVSYASPAPAAWVWSASELTSNRDPWLVVAQYA